VGARPAEKNSSGEIHVSQAETLAWNRARRSRMIELAVAIASGGGLIALVVVFYTILTR
jgi:hypothetical protein